MVDLVKIRKKARKAAGHESQQVAGHESRVAGAVQEVAGHESLAADAVQHEVADLSPEGPATRDSQLATEVPLATRDPQPATDPQPVTTTKLDRFKAAAGESVVTEHTVVEGTTTDAAVLELLTFIIAGEQYAVDIERIVEIVTPRPITRIPNADPSIVGIISLRGAIVTLVDVRRKLRHPTGATSAPDPRVVVIDQFGETVGFQVDRVVRVIKMSRAAVEPHPVVHVSEHDEAIAGVFRQGNALTILLDLDKLLGARALPGPVA
jgi:purine-binding chemotaxis protein CheW